MSTHSQNSVNQDLEDTKAYSMGMAPSESASKPRGPGSHSSRRTSNSASSLSILLAASRAKAESAKVAVEHARREALIQKQQALLKEREQTSFAQLKRERQELDADLLMIRQEKEVAMAEAEVRVFENHSEPIKEEFDLPMCNVDERIIHYVKEQSYATTHAPEPLEEPANEPQEPQSTLDHQVMQQFEPQPSHQVRNSDHRDEVNLSHAQAGLNINAASFQPSHNLNYLPSSDMEQMLLPKMNLTQFMLKKDLLLSRLVNFNDQPESYTAWKCSFKTVAKEAQVTPEEEFDLLVKWLGPNSSKHAVSLRAASSRNPSYGLQLLWERLDERYGSPELIEAALRRKITNFPKLTNKDNLKLYELSDIVTEIVAAKEDDKYATLLSSFDSSAGTNLIVNKLPYNLQEKWTNHASAYKRQHSVSYPPFTVFAKFLKEFSKIRNDPSFDYESRKDQPRPQQQHGQPKKGDSKHVVSARKTEVAPPRNVKSSTIDVSTTCPIHKLKHTLNECNTFKGKPHEERIAFIRENRICFRCCASTDHIAKNCSQDMSCKDCGKKHATALHIKDSQRTNKPSKPNQSEEQKPPENENNAVNKCTQICGNNFSGKSCAKILLLNVYPESSPQKTRTVYAIVDDQSNKSLATSEFFDMMEVEETRTAYTLTSCSGTSKAEGRMANNFVLESPFDKSKLSIKTVIECNQIPNSRDEIPTPEVASYHQHLQEIKDFIPPLNSASICLLIGRDIPEVHHVLDQRTGPSGTPYAQKLPLGWVIVGETCLTKIHKPAHVNVSKTNILPEGRQTIFELCSNRFEVREHHDSSENWPFQKYIGFGHDIFAKTSDDNKVGLSVEDKEFLTLMEQEISKDENGFWEMPLPFKDQRQRLPNNKQQALKRAEILDRSLKKDEVKMEHFLTFMKRIFDNNHAEVAPPLEAEKECWYLPVFGVYHPKKPDRIRAVFDSSARYGNVSLNDVLLTGPNLTNNLMGVLLRFRREMVAFTADIEQMFYCFRVNEKHRDYLRFMWYRNNDPTQDLIEYRMCVHVFGNSPSPAVATFGLRKTAALGTETYGEDVTNFVERNFYVDDALCSSTSTEEAIDLLKRTRSALSEGGKIRLHKIASNKPEIMEAFEPEEIAKDLKDMNFDSSMIPLQRSLGLYWNIQTDTFTFEHNQEEKPYTRRGILSTVNSLYDPLGFAAPVTIEGKRLIRKLITQTKEWDEPLPETYRNHWEKWKESLKDLEQFHVPRGYSTSTAKIIKRELHIFSDASESAIAAVAFLKTIHDDQHVDVSFVLGKTKLSPSHGHTIPRLELCAAVLAVELYDFIADNLDLDIDSTQFYTDSKIVLGYIQNKTRRFFKYVANRVERIHQSSSSEQWRYVHTDCNPADQGTRSIPASLLSESIWINGPAFLKKEYEIPEESFPLSDPDCDKEVKPEATTLSTHVSKSNELGTDRFSRFSSWKVLVEAIALLKHNAQSFLGESQCEHGKRWHTCPTSRTVESFIEAEKTVIKAVQQDEYASEIKCLTESTSLSKRSPLLSLDPYLDEDGVLRIGGRLSRSDMNIEQVHPIIIPGRHHIATLLVRRYHEEVRHQGRQYTEGSIRAAGYWITGVKRLVSSVLNKCVTCRRCRRIPETQKMSDLPIQRLQPSPPFSYVGVDCFGPWTISTKKTRGGAINSKRWAVLFTCLASRAVHIEVIEEMSSSSFIDALRRFVSIRGKVKEFYSDRGSNFIGATDDLQIDAINVEDGPVKDFVYGKGTVWKFNAPHSSHMGGVWERMIGLARKILDNMLMNSKMLTHEVLTTFMAEVCAIINGRPIIPVSSDPESPAILTPSALLTQKIEQSPAPLTTDDPKDMYRAQWKRVQFLADQFWSKWKKEYLHTLQQRSKWHHSSPNVSVGDVILLKDDSPRIEWPLGIVTATLPGEDEHVRKVTLRTTRNDKSLTRPITEVVLLFSSKNY